MKIYYQYSKVKNFKPTKGDFINEFNTLLALNEFSNVYYSGNLFENNSKTNYGMSDYPESIPEKCIKSNYDIYIVRANAKLFRAIKSPNKFWVASPYIEDCFAESKAILTFTKAWETALRTGQKCSLNPEGKVFKNVLTLHQTVNPIFKPQQSSEKTAKIRKSFGGDFVIGYFGKIKTKDRIGSFIRVVNRVRKTHPGVRLVFSSTNIVLNSKDIISSRFNYFDVPYAISACDLTICEGLSPLGGKLKVIESMACGVPIVSPRYREEQLGKNYELFYDREASPNHKYILSNKSEEQLYQAIIKAIEDKAFLEKAKKQVLERARFYSLSESSKRMKNDLLRIMKS